MDDHTSNITEQHTAGNAQIGTGRCLSYFYSDHTSRHPPSSEHIAFWRFGLVLTMLRIMPPYRRS